ncbi:MAG: response regulator [Gammaproteobacteria bacterium]|nr:response regulator [Gammaproteobacteria bacterium]
MPEQKVSAILLVDDERQVLDVLSEMLRLEGHDVVTAENGVVALERIQTDAFDLVFADIIMPKKEGLETISDIRKRQPQLPILAISGGGRIGPRDYLEAARHIGANATLAKSFGRNEFISMVDSLLA